MLFLIVCTTNGIQSHWYCVAAEDSETESELSTCEDTTTGKYSKNQNMFYVILAYQPF